MSRHRGGRRCKCGRPTSGPTATYCSDCRKDHRPVHSAQSTIAPLPPDLAERFRDFDREQLISYPLVAARLSISLQESIIMVNRLVQANLVTGHGVEQPYHFRWKKEDEW